MQHGQISITIKQNPLTIRSKGSELRSPLGKVGIPIDFSYYAGGPVLFGFLKFCLCCPNEGYSKTQFSMPIWTFFKVCTIFCEIAANQRKTRRLLKTILQEFENQASAPYICRSVVATRCRHRFRQVRWPVVRIRHKLHLPPAWSEDLPLPDSPSPPAIQFRATSSVHTLEQRQD